MILTFHFHHERSFLDWVENVISWQALKSIQKTGSIDGWYALLIQILFSQQIDLSLEEVCNHFRSGLLRFW